MMLIELHLPGESTVLAGFFLIESSSGELHIRVRKDWPEVLDPLNREYLESVEETILAYQREMGNERLLEYLEGTLSNFILLSVHLKFHHDITAIAQLADKLAGTLLCPPTTSSD